MPIHKKATAFKGIAFPCGRNHAEKNNISLQTAVAIWGYKRCSQNRLTANSPWRVFFPKPMRAIWLLIVVLGFIP